MSDTQPPTVARIETYQRYGTHNGLPVPGTLIKDEERLDYRYEDGTHQLTIWGPYTNAEPDLNMETDDVADVIKHLVGYPDNAEVQALIEWLESGCDPASFPGAIGVDAGRPVVTLPTTAAHGMRFSVEGFTWQAVWEGEHFFWERLSHPGGVGVSEKEQEQ